MAIGVNILERGILRNCSNSNDGDDDGGDGDDPKRTKKPEGNRMSLKCMPACLLLDALKRAHK